MELHFGVHHQAQGGLSHLFVAKNDDADKRAKAPADDAAAAQAPATDSFHKSDGTVQVSGDSRAHDDDTEAGIAFASVGDPHDSVKGKVDGKNVNAKFNDGSGHSDLVDVGDGIKGGYQIATEVTAPAKNGARYNSEATVVTNFGKDVVSVDKSGNVTVVSDGTVQDVSADIKSGKTITLAGGATVTFGTDGTVTVTAAKNDDAKISTQLKATGKGVNVRGAEEGLDVGGFLADKASGVKAKPDAEPTSETVSSTGDPHLRLSETTADGGKISAHFDSQVDHSNLASTDDVAGGFRISTEETAVHHGVAFNKTVTVSSNDFEDIVSVNKDGSAKIVSDGKQVTLAAGGSVTLANGEVVKEAASGKSFTVSETHGNVSITTTINVTKSGLDVYSTAKNADFGGYIVGRALDALA